MIITWQNTKLKVVEKDGFKSLIAKQNIKKGDIVCFVEGETLHIPNRYSVQVGDNQHINVKAPAKFINHNCDGNIALVGMAFTAIKDIAAEDEITFDYNTTEDVLDEPFKCFRCGQLVKGKLFTNEYPCYNLN